ncbi:hypothetical protein HID58_087400, partial [Brassica napus]
TNMPMVTSDPITLLNDVKPFKTTWKVEVKVLHSWTQHSSYSGGDSLQFILADKRGVKIHCTCKRLFYGRVKKLQASVETSLIFNFFNNMVVDVIGQAIDIGDIQVVPAQGGKETKKLELTLTDTEDQQVACCLRGQFAEQMLHTSKVAQVNQNFLCLLRFAKINVYKGQVQITNAFDSSTIEINPPGFDVQDYLQVLPNNDIALTTGSHEVAKTQGNKRPLDKWSTYPERSILDIIMATEDDTGETRVLLLDSIAEPILGVSAEVLLDVLRVDTTCLSSTPLSKRKGNNEIDDLSSTSKKQCSKIIKVEKNGGEMKRKHQPPLGADGHRLCSKPQSKQRIDHKKNKDVPLSTVFERLLHDVTNRKVSSRFQTQKIMTTLNKLKRVEYMKIFLGSIDECDDLEIECSSQDSSDTEISDDEQSTVQEPEKVDQSGRVNLLAALFKKTFTEVKTKAKAVSSKEEG